MSFKDGWAAVNLEMPKRIPRTEAAYDRCLYSLMKN
jgi:hypothetical protein